LRKWATSERCDDNKEPAMILRGVYAAVLLLVVVGDTWAQSPGKEEPKPPALTEHQKKQAEELKRLGAEYQAQTAARSWAAAAKTLEKMIAVQREFAGGVPTPETARLLGVLSQLCLRQENFAGARKAQEEEANIYTRLYGKDDWRVTDARLALDRITQVEKLDEAGRLQLQEANQTANRAIQLRMQGKIREAIPLYQQASDIYKKTLGENHPDHVNNLNNLGVLYEVAGDHGKALSLYQQGRDLCKKTLGEHHPEYARSLHNLGVLYQLTGDYGKALPLLDQARYIRKKTLGEGHPEYAESLNFLAMLYQLTGDYGKALPLYQQAHDIAKQTLGENHPHYASTLNNLAAIHSLIGDYPKALQFYEQARDLTKKTLGENHSDYANKLNNLALLHRSMGDHGKALPLFEQALAIREKTLGEEHPDYAQSLNNLAALHRDTGDYAKALPLLEQARDLFKKTLGENSTAYATSLHNLAALYLDMAEPSKAARLAHQALVARTAASDVTFAAQSARLRLQLLSNYHHVLNLYLSVALPHNADPAEIHGHVLAWKGAVASRQAEERIALEQPELMPLLDNLRQARTGLAQLAQSPPRDPKRHKDWVRRLHAVEADKERLETELAFQSAAFRRARSLSSQTVADTLPPGTAFVDLIKLTHLIPSGNQKGRYEPQDRYLAFVLLKGRTPVVVELGQAQPIEDAVTAWRKTGRLALTPDANARRLKELVWLPIHKHLGDARTVYLSPDGSLSQLPFAALPGSQAGSFLLEEFTFDHIPSGRHLLDLAAKRKDPPRSGLLLVGGLDFGKPSAPTDGAWQELPGTRLEAERLAALFARSYPSEREAKLLSGSDIDAARLRREAVPERGPRRRFLHLATHGFFHEPKQTSAKPRAKEGALTQEEMQKLYTYDRNPLLSSGLVLSGANADPGRGVLTAEEVLDLDLRGLDLAVLSACETGLGKVEGSQGVQGLQLAFHTAGVRTLVASLWHVDDAATSVLMEEFYTNLWQRKLSRVEALRQAQLTVMKDPERVKARAGELRDLLVKRGVSEEVLASRGLKKAVDLPDGGKTETGARRSPPSWWAAFLLSGDPGMIE